LAGEHRAVPRQPWRIRAVLDDVPGALERLARALAAAILSGGGRDARIRPTTALALATDRCALGK